jgi:hypothetical protein
MDLHAWRTVTLFEKCANQTLFEKCAKQVDPVNIVAIRTTM